MRIRRFLYPAIISVLCLFVFAACNNNKVKQTGDTIASTPEDLQEKTKDLIRSSLEKAVNNNGRPEDATILLAQAGFARSLYEKNDFTPIWGSKEQWLPAGDSLFQFIENSELFGLFPADYHIKELNEIRIKFIHDRSAKSDRKDAALCAGAHIILTQ